MPEPRSAEEQWQEAFETFCEGLKGDEDFNHAVGAWVAHQVAQECAVLQQRVVTLVTRRRSLLLLQPPEALDLLEAALAAGRAGTIHFDLKDHRILGWRFDQRRRTKIDSRTRTRVG